MSRWGDVHTRVRGAGYTQYFAQSHAHHYGITSPLSNCRLGFTLNPKPLCPTAVHLPPK